MKKGCFIKSIVILTIFVASITYIVQNKLDEWIIKPVKKIILPMVENSFSKEFEYVKDTPEKDSVLIYIRDFFEGIDFKTGNDSSKQEFWNAVKEIVSDSIITKLELEDLKKIPRLKNEE